MEEKRYLFEEDKVSHALAVMALPAIASQLITLVYNLADTWFVGRTNNPYMVASSVLFSFLCLWGHLVLFASQYRAFFTGLLWSQYGWAVKYSA